MVDTIDVVRGSSNSHCWIEYLSVIVVAIISEELLIACLGAPTPARDIFIDLASRIRVKTF